MKILHLDSNHPVLKERLAAAGCENFDDFVSSKQEVETFIHQYDGIVIRSRFKIDRTFIDAASKLKFIARVGAGLESIDCEYATSKGIALIAAPEGNRNAVGEHALGMLLAVMNKFLSAHHEVIQGKWLREKNRGYELDGLTVGIIGYGNMGKSFAKKLRGFDVEVICYDIKNRVGDENARQVSKDEFLQRAQVVSLHVPLDAGTQFMINSDFFNQMQNRFWLINTARGPVVKTTSLIAALDSGKVLGAGLDVIEFEKASFETVMDENSENYEIFKQLISYPNVLLTPHVGGWSFESHVKLADVIVDKILALRNTK